MPIICSAAILHTMIAICLLTWKPNAEYKIIYFIISGAWGLVDGVWLVQINGKSILNDKAKIKLR